MELILTNAAGEQIKDLRDVDFDCELNGGDRDFALTILASEYSQDYGIDNRVAEIGTEVGGLIGTISTDTGENSVTVGGYTWRGLLEKKIICPPSGSDYYKVSGELNTVISSLISEHYAGEIFTGVTVSTGVQVTNYQFDRFCTLRAGLEKMLASVGYRLEIQYRQDAPNTGGYVAVYAMPVRDYSDELELSQDSGINFNMFQKKNGCNHLVITGKGELQDRTVMHLYVQADGKIGTKQHYKGIKEITDLYENTSTDTDQLKSYGTEKLQELMDSGYFEMDASSMNLDVQIGDIVGGRDYITGNRMKKPIANIIYKLSGRKLEKNYQLEGSD